MKVNLLEYLDKLEAMAKEAAARIPDGMVIVQHGVSDRPYVLATQPRAALALIAKLRDAVALVAELRRQMEMNRGTAGLGAGYDVTEREEYRRFVEDHIKRSSNFNEIEVPE